jgi:TetR/AcrR family mexXY operon transcriptional repressor
MARKTKEDTQKTIVSVMDAAELVFVEKGVANTTIADIAKRAGVSKGAVYGHYKDKMDLCVVVCVRGIEEFNTQMVVPAQATQLDTLHAFGLEYFRVMNESLRVKNVIDILYCKCEKSPEFEPVQQIRYGWENSAWEQTAQVLQRAVQAGELDKETDLELANFYYRSLLDGITFSFLYSDRMDDSYRARVGRVLMHGIETLRRPGGMK